MYLPMRTNTQTQCGDSMRVFNNWTFGKRRYDTWVNRLLKAVERDKTKTEAVLKLIRKTLVEGKAPWLSDDIDPTAKTGGADDTDEGE